VELTDTSTDGVLDRALRVVVRSSGYVGLPTAALFADAGFNVTAVDMKSKIVESANGGVSTVNEPSLQELVSRNVRAGKLKAVLNSDITLNQGDAIVISVQTPIDKNKKPNLSFLMNTLENVGKNLKKEMLVAICSTVLPRKMQEKNKPLLESLSGLKADTDFYLAYVPERIAPGKALKEKTPRKSELKCQYSQ
jgi:UDP-N-acetyl-D-mannosaminuronic acid dehydrogenase